MGQKKFALKPYLKVFLCSKKDFFFFFCDYSSKTLLPKNYLRKKKLRFLIGPLPCCPLTGSASQLLVSVKFLSVYSKN